LRILLVSDLHVPVRLSTLPNSLLNLLQEADMTIACGDYVDLDTVLTLKTYSRQFYGVHGNMDYADVKEHLPSQALVQIDSLMIGICHGWGAPHQIRERILSTFKNKPQIIFYGHTHSTDDSFVESVRFINPGAFCDGSFALVETCVNQLRVDFKRL